MTPEPSLGRAAGKGKGVILRVWIGCPATRERVERESPGYNLQVGDRYPIDGASAKQEACLAVLRDYVDRKAFARVRQPNPALRFYADMLILQNDIGPRFTKENDLERFALWPLSRLVFDWVKRHTEPVSVRPIV